MDFILSLLVKSAGQVWLTLLHNWPYLLVSVLMAVLLKRYINAEKVSAFLKRNNKAGVVAATTVAVATPLCSCGTTAVVLGMMASTMPWAPIVAFMVSSPLTSPEGMIYSAGLFGWPFAIAFFLSSIFLGLGGGWAATIFENRGWLKNQTRFTAPVPSRCACSVAPEQPPVMDRVYSLEVPLMDTKVSCGCGQSVPSSAPAETCVCQGPETSCDCEQPVVSCSCSPTVMEGPTGPASFLAMHLPTIKIPELWKEILSSAKRLLTMFLGFAFLGYLLNGLIPASWVAAVFGSGHAYSVPLAATLALPFYINSEASLPLIRTLLDAGMSQGAAMAFLIAGAGTSIGAIGGALTIARWRVIALVVVVLWAGAILCGYVFDLALAIKLF